MKMSPLSVLVFVIVLSTTNVSTQERPDSRSQSYSKGDFPVGVGFKVSSLGIGGDVAFPISRRTNLRAGFNAFSYSGDFDKDGVVYTGDLKLVSVQGYWDFFPFGGAFHVSPGLMLYNGTDLLANAQVPASKSFDLGDGTYISSSSDPIRGTAKAGLNKVAPMFLVGWGNLVPRTSKRVSFTIEGGFAYIGEPDVKLNFVGSACDTNGTDCSSVIADPSFQTNLRREQNKIKDDAAAFRFYPVLSVGVGYRF